MTTLSEPKQQVALPDPEQRERLHAEVLGIVPDDILLIYGVPPIQISSGAAREIASLLTVLKPTQTTLRLQFDLRTNAAGESLSFVCYKLIAPKPGAPAELMRCVFPIADGELAVELSQALLDANAALLELEARPKNFKIEKVGFDNPK